MTGYEVDPDVPGGGYFMVRNSWGTTWGCNNPIAPGYARMPFAYIAQYGNSAYTAKLPPINLWQRFIGWIRRLLGIGYL
jgi:C1A family cysteine protease